MTDQETVQRPTGTEAAIRNELWESRHLMAALHLEIQRGDEAYAALGVTLAGERAHHAAIEAELGRTSVELARAMVLLEEVRLARVAEADAFAAVVLAHDAAVQDHRNALALYTDVRSAGESTAARLSLLAVEHEALLQTRTFRWSHRARRVYGWALARRPRG